MQDPRGLEIPLRTPIGKGAMHTPTTDYTRVAFLSLDEPTDDLTGNRRILGGVSLLERQVDVALALGARKIWLHARHQDQLALRAQRLAEQGGADFRLLRTGKQLVGAMRQQDELLVLAEGWLPADEEALAAFDRSPVVLTFPWETCSQAGFQRLDRSNGWAGAMILPGRVLERLDELDEEMDPVSALLRAARVTRVPERGVPDDWLVSGRWSLEPKAVPSVTPGVDGERRSTLDQLVLAPLGGFLGERPQAVIATAVAAGLSAIAALALLILHLPAACLLAVAAATFLTRAWLSSRDRADPRVFSGGGGRDLLKLLRYAPALVGLLALVTGLQMAFGWQSTLYMALVTCVVWWLAGYQRHRFAALFRDHEWLWLLCGAFGLAGQWFVPVALASTVALAAILFNARNQPAITRA